MRRILRLGLIHNGRIIEERLIRHGGHITVGSQPGNTLVLPPGAAIKRHRLFKRTGSGYTLEYTHEMSGRIANGGHVLDLAAVVETGWAKPARAYQLALTEEVRGKIKIEGYQILFQFVQAPPDARLQLPSSMRRGRGLDWPFLGTLAASALVQGILVASMLTMDFPEAPRALDLDDRFISEFIAPPKDAPEAEATEEPAAEEPDEGPKVVERTEPKPKATKPAPEPEVDPNDAVAVAAAHKAKIDARIKNETVIGALGHLGGGGEGEIVDILTGGAAQVSMEDAFRGADRVALNVPTQGRDRRPHHRAPTTGAVANIKLGRRNLAKGPVKLKAKKEKAVPVSVTTGTVKEPIGTGTLSAATIAKKVRKKLPLIKSCYERHLNREGSLAGKIVVEFTIGRTGRVSQAKVVRNTLKHKALGECIVQRFKRRLRFPKPKGGTVTARFPFVFTPKG